MLMSPASVFAHGIFALAWSMAKTSELLIIDDGVWPVLVDHPTQEAPMQTFM